jgi:hypothetical protein
VEQQHGVVVQKGGPLLQETVWAAEPVPAG